MKTNEKIYLKRVNKLSFSHYLSILYQIDDISRSPKRTKLKSSDEIQPVNTSSSIYPTTATVAVPLSCLIDPNFQQTNSNSYTIDLNSLRTNGRNIVLTPPSLSSDTPLVLTFGHFPYQPFSSG